MVRYHDEDKRESSRADQLDFGDEVARRIAANPPRPLPPPPAERPQVTLTIEQLYAFETTYQGRRTAAKEAAIRVAFGITTSRYYQQLFCHVDTPAALELNPVLTHWIQDQRDRRAALRATRSRTATE